MTFNPYRTRCNILSDKHINLYGCFVLGVNTLCDLHMNLDHLALSHICDNCPERVKKSLMNGRPQSRTCLCRNCTPGLRGAYMKTQEMCITMDSYVCHCIALCKAPAADC